MIYVRPLVSLLSTAFGVRSWIGQSKDNWTLVTFGHRFDNIFSKGPTNSWRSDNCMWFDSSNNLSQIFDRLVVFDEVDKTRVQVLTKIMSNNRKML